MPTVPRTATTEKKNQSRPRLEVVKPARDDAALGRLLREAGMAVAPETIAAWTPEQATDAEEYARAVILAMGPRPAYLPQASTEIPEHEDERAARADTITLAAFAGYSTGWASIARLALDEVLIASANLEAAISTAERAMDETLTGADRDQISDVLDQREMGRDHLREAMRQVHVLALDLEQQARDARRGGL